MCTRNRLDLQTPGSQPVMPNNLYDHWIARDITILLFPPDAAPIPMEYFKH